MSLFPLKFKISSYSIHFTISHLHEMKRVETHVRGKKGGQLHSQFLPTALSDTQ